MRKFLMLALLWFVWSTLAWETGFVVGLVLQIWVWAVQMVIWVGHDRACDASVRALWDDHFKRLHTLTGPEWAAEIAFLIKMSD